MTAKLLMDGLFAISVGPVNTFLLDEAEGCTLIDAGFPGKADAILQGLAEVGKKPGDVRHIAITHAHPDHIGGLAALKNATGAEVYMHPLDAAIAAAGKGFRPITPTPGFINGIMFRIFVRDIRNVEPASIEHTVEDGEILPIANGLEAIHIPGHCLGQLAFLWPRHGGVLFAADACSNMMGLTWSLGYEDFEEGKRSLRKLAGHDFQMACFGHGKAISHDASARFRKKWG